jgi:hypothetical protein
LAGAFRYRDHKTFFFIIIDEEANQARALGKTIGMLPIPSIS